MHRAFPAIAPVQLAGTLLVLHDTVSELRLLDEDTTLETMIVQFRTEFGGATCAGQTVKDNLTIAGFQPVGCQPISTAHCIDRHCIPANGFNM